MNKFFFVAIVIATFSACADNQPDHDPSIVPAGSEKTASGAVTDSGSNIQNTASPAAVNTQTPGNIINNGQAITPAVVQTATQSVNTAPGMNPPHGQPNHRCDIAVGAPLNSPATKPAVQTTQTVTQTPAPVAKTAPGMNPPHGQPNHRCDIAVGAPLNSPVAKPAITPVAAPVTAQPAEAKALKN